MMTLNVQNVHRWLTHICSLHTGKSDLSRLLFSRSIWLLLTVGFRHSLWWCTNLRSDSLRLVRWSASCLMSLWP